MNLDRVGYGRKLPEEFNVIIEIPMNSDPVKYEVDKETGAMFVDRFMSTPMRYPCNYGYIPHTLCGDGDPVETVLEWGVRSLDKQVEVHAEGDLPAKASADLFPAYDDDGGLLLVLTPAK